jgi:membrane protein
MYDPQNYNSKYTVSQSGTGVSFVSVMKNVYLWMTLALAITGLTAMAVATQPEIVYTIFTNKLLFWGLIGAELGIVWFVSSRVMSLSVTTSGILFAIYALLNGVFFSSIFLVFEIGSIAQTFFITAGVFASMGAVGLFIKRDLSMIGRIFYMALIGLIIATVVNWFFKNDTLMSICNYAGVVIFTALTAYDTQKIKNMLVQVGDADSDTGLRISLLGSLTLYLDFINLFLYLLRIFGRRR